MTQIRKNSIKTLVQYCNIIRNKIPKFAGKYWNVTNGFRKRRRAFDETIPIFFMGSYFAFFAVRNRYFPDGTNWL